MRRLRDRMREDLTLRGLGTNTIEAYLGCVRKFAEHFGRSPSALGADEIREFQLELRRRKVSASTFNVYAAAFKFLYRFTLDRPEQVARIRCMRVPMHLPTVLSGSEMSRLIAALDARAKEHQAQHLVRPFDAAGSKLAKTSSTIAASRASILKPPTAPSLRL